MPIIHNRIGDVYGMLTVLARAENDKHGNTQWSCLCSCGVVKVVNGCALQQGDTRSCGCYQSHLRPYESLYNRLVNSSKHHVDISYEEFVGLISDKECHYCGEPLTWRSHYAGKGGWQLDRKDTSKGYSMGNVVTCCKRCNIGKNKYFTYEEWKQLGDVIRGWKK